MVKRKLVVGNWKMHGIVPETSIMLEKLKKEVEDIKKVEIVVCPPFVDLYTANISVNGTNIELGSQNVFYEEQGPYTGEISPLMLKGLCKYVIVGHSERRIHFLETDKIIAKKVAAAVRHGLTPILCVGDTLQDFNDGFSKITILSQLQAALHLITKDEVAKVVIAYEPVWAIGTGKNCSAKRATEVAKDIKHTIAELFGKAISEKMRVLYGGSVKAKNANVYFDDPDIDGVLVGGASVDHFEFAKIIKGAEKHTK
ncbi:TPA: triose-phosphate isomerase [candidate division CPR2 bacterium]|uniref:Triosephosphate isomerase n=1 Tax=candidate division CPR2 bacterium GW2011_GWC1_41_48 TaxID=1618344 RepID=A0A0G0W804_UNCC2|nr:MAG: Triosephosphate isomerase [candidate division CPR2 bacterium GW2011_GWC2_39_35]KKR27370.1 MAG: Triosephosphate isomerase [candidate division CPR2 bacterium GW2011_GWD1_39_7]KKR27667.1 MAG: Triosephosphate isomerase [candidate division CPR2 bacterium GW2011_GWD2_39_7]KKS09114.1 MAG: Triosephosphate isomerase [candidate division CPR2 bacterium GW2011_GWC1_41_48]OGB58387.1 MAG: triose-phosphate isomerase [candidate division CPR2 bacterium GWD1_39_7]OGB71639.1 MAG: triose-phosphate isomera